MRYPIIFRYLFGQHLRLALLVVGCMFLVVLLGQFAELARYQSELPGWSSLRTLQMSLFRAPTLMQSVLPHVVLVSAALTVSRAGRRLEVAILMQNGLSALRLLWPVALAGALIGAVFSLAVNPVASRAFAQAEMVLGGVAADVSDPSHREPRELVLRQGDGAIYLLIEHVAPDADIIHGVSFFRVNADNVLLESLEAKRGMATDTGWQLDDVRELFTGPGVTVFDPVSDRLHFSVAALSERYDKKESVSIYHLPQRITLARIVGAPTRALEVQLVWLSALPLLLGSIAFLAGAIVIRPLQRSAWKSDAVLVLGAAFTIYTVSTVFDALGVRGLVTPPVTAGILPVLCTLAGSVLLWLKRGGNRILRNPFRGSGRHDGTATGPAPAPHPG